MSGQAIPAVAAVSVVFTILNSTWLATANISTRSYRAIMRQQLKTVSAIVVSALFIVAGVIATMAGTSTITVLDSTGSTQTYAVVTDGSGHFIAEHVICDYSAGANCASVNTTHQVLVEGSNGTDTAYAGSGSTSLNGYLKGIYNAAVGPIPAQTPSNTTGIGSVSVDPCAYGAKTNIAFSQNTTPANQIIAASGTTKIYICSMSMIAGGATTFSWVTGTGSNCGSSQTAVVGVTQSNVASQGLSLAANGGMTYGSGAGTVGLTPASGELCLTLGSAQYLAGNLTYVQQ